MIHNNIMYKNLYILVLLLLITSCATTKTEYYGATVKSTDSKIDYNLGVLELKIELNIFENSDRVSYSSRLEILDSPSASDFYLIRVRNTDEIDGQDVIRSYNRSESLLPFLITDVISPQYSSGDYIIETTLGNFTKDKIDVLGSEPIPFGTIIGSTLLPGPNWTFLKPSEFLFGASNSGSETVSLRIFFRDPPSYSFQPREALPNHYLPSQTFRVQTWNLRKVISNYFHSGVKLSILDARSLTPIQGTEIIILSDNLPNPIDAFKNQKVYENIVASNPELFGMPTETISRTNNRGEYHLFPYFASSVQDSVQILVRHPNYEPFQGYLNIENEEEEWEILLPRIGQRIEVDEAPELDARIRKKGNSN